MSHKEKSRNLLTKESADVQDVMAEVLGHRPGDPARVVTMQQSMQQSMQDQISSKLSL